MATLTLLARSSGIAPVFRQGVVMLLIACTVPIAATFAYDLGLGPHTVSYVPFVFAAMLPVYSWLLISERVVEFAPLAYETVFQNMQDPVVVVDDHGRIIGLNAVAQGLLDIGEKDALRMPLDAVFGGGATCVLEAIDSGKPQKMMTESGRYLHVKVSPIAKTGGLSHGGQVLMFRDVSDVERAQAEVRRSERLLRTLIDHSVNGVLRLRRVADSESGATSLRCIFANAAAGRFLSVEPDDLVDSDLRNILRRATSGMTADEAEALVSGMADSIANGQGVDVEVRHKNPTTKRWLRVICEPVGEDIAMTLVDVTDGKAQQRQMESMARSDPLTGVLNRRGFERDASQRLTDSKDDATGALLFIDLNDFKQINDRSGHDAGDELLRIAARRLRSSLRSNDIIGRPGGDEFVALVPDVDAEIAEKLAHRLTEALEKPYTIAGETHHCSASIGLALYPKNANTLTGLLREADQAMYRAKARSRDATELRASTLLEKAV
jgi:diguanylate cyclase (GGDEF)-like protein